MSIEHKLGEKVLEPQNTASKGKEEHLLKAVQEAYKHNAMNPGQDKNSSFQNQVQLIDKNAHKKGGALEKFPDLHLQGFTRNEQLILSDRKAGSANAKHLYIVDKEGKIVARSEVENHKVLAWEKDSKGANDQAVQRDPRHHDRVSGIADKVALKYNTIDFQIPQEVALKQGPGLPDLTLSRQGYSHTYLDANKQPYLLSVDQAKGSVSLTQLDPKAENRAVRSIKINSDGSSVYKSDLDCNPRILSKDATGKQTSLLQYSDNGNLQGSLLTTNGHYIHFNRTGAGNGISRGDDGKQYFFKDSPETGMLSLSQVNDKGVPTKTINVYPNGSVLERSYAEDNKGQIQSARIGGQKWTWDGYAYISEDGSKEAQIRERHGLPVVLKVSSIEK